VYLAERLGVNGKAAKAQPAPHGHTGRVVFDATDAARLVGPLLNDDGGGCTKVNLATHAAWLADAPNSGPRNDNRARGNRRGYMHRHGVEGAYGCLLRRRHETGDCIPRVGHAADGVQN
jgi:hypothetical protein